MAGEKQNPKPAVVIVTSVAIVAAFIFGATVVVPALVAVGENTYSTLKSAPAECISSWDRALEPQWANGKCSILQEDQRVPIDATSSYYGIKPAHRRD